jgi:tight adherence protein B
MTLITAFLGALAVIAFFAGMYAIFEQSDSVPDRLQAYASMSRERDGADRPRSGLAPLLGRLDRLLSGQSTAQRMALLLAQANIQMTLPEFLMIEGSVAVVGGVVGLMASGQIISALAGGLLGLAGPYLYVQRKRQKRIDAFHGQLVDVLSLIVGSLRGGHALTTALDLVSKELSPPAAEEFGRVLREIGFGLTQTEALNNLVTRMESDDLQLVVTAVNISHEVGGSLSEVLEKITETIRERIRLQGEIRVLTTQQRLTTYLLVALPIVLTMVLSVINPDWIMRLFAPGWVRIIPVMALVMEIIGFLISQRLTRIEV